MRHAVVAIAVACLAGGCLSSAHKIPKRDLQALAQVDPAQRGKRVRVIQATANEASPPPAQRVDSGAHVHVGVVVVPSHHHGHSGGVGGGGGGSGFSTNKAKGKSDDAKAWLIIAAAVAVGLAATEGARYDGWVELHPMHPVHLYGPYGEYLVAPLAHIDPQTAAWAQKALVRPGEGPWTTLGRAPLNRQGWTYSVLMGAGKIASVDDTVEPGFFSHIQLGNFPSKELGIVLDIGLGWRDNLADATVFDSRYGLELQAMPVAAGKLHAGGFGQIGIGARFEDYVKNGDKRSVIYGGGGMLQLEITTRLALTARAAYMMVYDEPVSDLTLGLSIY
jgi:hypothetical protein